MFFNVPCYSCSQNIIRMKIIAVIIVLFFIAIKESHNLFSNEKPSSALIFENGQVLLHNDKISYNMLKSKPQFIQITGSYLNIDSYYSIIIIIKLPDSNSFEVIYCALNLKGKDLKEGVFLNQLKEENIYINFIFPSEHTVFNLNYDDQNMYVIYSPHSRPIKKDTLENFPYTIFTLDESDCELVQFSKSSKITEFDVLTKSRVKYSYIKIRLVRSKTMLNDVARKKFFSTMVKRENTIKND
ncbi:uncharacterized protein LOC142320297 [Lycorma delicatula]|uniref:uncharacterized protein LOC142320297 n=1 Tax=Lycorma delicatula TaxID=130591 RepID=UPI003F5127A6